MNWDELLQRIIVILTILEKLKGLFFSKPKGANPSKRSAKRKKKKKGSKKKK